jgi:hypothetical protein
MKKIKFLMVLALTTLVFTACQKEDTNVYDQLGTEQLSNQEKSINDIVGNSNIENAAKAGDFVIEGNVARQENQEIKLDYHEKYGEVKADEFPMDPRGIQEPSLDFFLERSGINENEIADYSIKRDRFSGIGYAQHRMPDGEVIEVAHRFENESIYRFEGELKDGKRFSIIIIIICSNGLIIVIIW